MIHWFRYLGERLATLNLFERGSVDAHTKRNEILSTRLYIVVLVLLLTTLTVFTSLQSETNVITKDVANGEEYEELRLKYADSLHCPCKRISGRYDQFLTIRPRYHEICLSDFVTQKWIDYLFYDNTSYYFQLDFRRDASARFQLLRVLCEQAQQAISDRLNDFYSFELITNELISRSSFDIQLNSPVQLFQRTMPSSFQNLLKIIRQTTIANGIISAVDTGLGYAFHPSDVTRIYLDGIYYYEVTQQDKLFDCYCGEYTMCELPQGIYGQMDRYDYAGSDWIGDYNINATTAGINATFLVPGMLTGCKPIESLMRSTSECLYNQTCLDRIGSYINFSSISIRSFRTLNQSQEKKNRTFETLAENLFVEEWIIDKSYANYFSSCEPLFCQYSVGQTRSFIRILATIIKLYGGLRLALVLCIPVLIKLIRRKKSPYDQKPTVSKTKRVIKLLRDFMKYLVQLNIFDKYSNDEHIQRNGRFSTKVYCVTLIACLSVFGIYLATENRSETQFLRNPSRNAFEQLQNASANNLQCPCTNISIRYAEFATLSPAYHQVCSSVFASNLWYNAYEIWNISASCYYPSFQNLASYYFSTLLTICQSANETVSNGLAQFYASEYVTSNAVSQKEFKGEVLSFLQQFQLRLQNSFGEQNNLLQNVLSNNQIFSVRKTNAIMTGKMINNSVVPSFNMKDHGNCTCGTNSTCAETVGFCIAGRRDYIRGMRVGCYLTQSLLLSTTECLYDQSCLDTIKSYMFTSAPIYSQVNALNSSLPSQYKTDDLIGTIVQNLLIEAWNEQISYQNYYDQCRPLLCSYVTRQRSTFLAILTNIIGVFGGLSIILRFFIPSIVNRIWRKKIKQPAVSVASRIRHFYATFKNNVVHLNLFRDHSTDKEKVRQQLLTTRLYIIVFVVTLSFLVVITAVTTRSVTENVALTSLSQYERLQAKHPHTLICPCADISIEYKKLVTLNMTYHQVCSSDFVRQPWFDYLYNQERVMDRNFRATASAQFQSLASLCRLTNETIATRLTQFYSTKFISGQMISNQTFQNQIDVIVNLFQSSIPRTFKRTLNMIHDMIHGNFYISVYQTNWKFTNLLRKNFVPIYTNPIKYNQSCSCGTSSKCSESVIIENSVVDGLVMGCYPMQSIMQSSLRCLYNQTCLQIVLSHFRVESANISFHALRRHDSYDSDERVEQMMERLFVDRWDVLRSYENYYQQCQATSCTYSYIEYFNILHVVTTVLGLSRGLATAFRLLIPLVMYVIYQLFCRRRTSVTHSSQASVRNET